MDEPKKNSESGQNHVECVSPGEIVHIREEDTVPEPPNERYRKWLEKKYGRKRSPPDGPEQAKET